jgi:predicted Zn finger-like uncharacterized protein
MNFACPKCRKQLSVPDDKVPATQFTVKCPQCTHPITVDPKVSPAAKASVAPSPAGFAGAEPSEEYDVADDFGEKALLVGIDSQTIRQVVKSLGLVPIHMAAPDAARDYFVREYPAIVFLLPQQLTPPPLADYAPLLSVSPMDRRKGFFILVAENLRTFDGNAAFLYGVNLIVAAKDLGSFPTIYRDAMSFHNRLYAAVNSVGTAVV